MLTVNGLKSKRCLLAVADPGGGAEGPCPPPPGAVKISHKKKAAA